MTLQQLVYFKKVSECLNITKASNELYVSQPSLSASLKKLELELGADLFDRSGHMMKLTQAGNLALLYANQIISLSQQLKKEVTNIHNSSKSKISFAYINPLSKKYVPNLLQHIQKVSPSVDIQINALELTTKQIKSALLNDSIEFGLCCRIDDRSELTQVPIIDQPLVLVASKEHALSRMYQQDPGISFTIRDILPYDFITYVPDAQITELIADFFKVNNFFPSIRYSMVNEDAILRLVKKDLGVAIIALTDDFKDDDIICLPLSELTQKRTIYLTYKTPGPHNHFSESIVNYICTTGLK